MCAIHGQPDSGCSQPSYVQTDWSNHHPPLQPSANFIFSMFFPVMADG